MTISGGEGGARVVLRLVCDRGADKDDPLLMFVEEEQDSTYVFTMDTPEACDRVGSVSEGFDWAWFLFFPGVGGFILLLAMAGFLAYVVIGVALNAGRRGKRGVEAFPQHEFWIALPGLIADGVRLIAGGCAACVGRIRGAAGGRGKYADLDSDMVA